MTVTNYLAIYVAVVKFNHVIAILCCSIAYNTEYTVGTRSKLDLFTNVP